MSFLIVDENRHLRRMLRGMLNDAFPGIDVLDAVTGEAACESCAKHKPRIVLMDDRLPDANGIELIPRLQSLVPSTRVVIVSNHDSLGHHDRAFVAGAWAFIPKNDLAHELVPTLRAVLAADRTEPR